MISKIKSNLVKMIGPLGGYAIARFLTRYQPRILMYHRFSRDSRVNFVSQAEFEKQVIELKRTFNVVPLSVLVKSVKGEIHKKKNMISITIDDGYKDFYKYAYPVLKKYGITATLYVTVDFIDEKIWLWPDILTYIILNTHINKYVFNECNTVKKYVLENKKDKRKLWADIVDYCLSIPNKDKNVFLNKFSEQLDVVIPVRPTEDYSAASWDMLEEMTKNGIDIGAHTSTHPSLSKVGNDELDYEIRRSKIYLQNRLGVDVQSFCYPNGQSNDYNKDIIEYIKAVGYSSSTVAYNDGDPYSDTYELRRHAVGGNGFQFKKAINGVELLGCKFKKIMK